MKKIWTTSSPHGILDHSYPTSASTEECCRVAYFKGSLYCVYVDGLRELGTVKVIRKASNAGLWSEPASVSDILPRWAPCLFTFKDQLHVLYASTLGSSVLLTLDEASGLFVFNRTLDIFLEMTPTVAVLAGRLVLFHHNHDAPRNIWQRSTLDLKDWTRSTLVKSDGVNAVHSNLSPLAITYQRLIHLVYKDVGGGFHLLRFDGVRQWSRAQLLVPDDYPCSPAAAVHNGLLKLFFTQATADTPAADARYDIHQYAYDGNVLGPVTVSTALGATNSPGAAVQDGVLHLLYRGKP